ncbi:MAG: hypothetical protein WBP55_01955 [Solirubrobacterales bacterium]
MDRKFGAVLAVAIIGLVVGIVGIFMANDAKNSNEETQAQIAKAADEADNAVVKKAAKVAAGLKAAGKAVDEKVQKQASEAESAVAAQEKKDAATAAADQAAVAALQSKIDELTREIADVEGKQKSNTAKVNSRIDSLESRIGN